MLSITGEVFQRRDGSFVIRTSDGNMHTIGELLMEFGVPEIEQQYPADREPGKLLTITVADSVDSPYAW